MSEKNHVIFITETKYHYIYFKLYHITSSAQNKIIPKPRLLIILHEDTLSTNIKQQRYKQQKLPNIPGLASFLSHRGEQRDCYDQPAMTAGLAKHTPLQVTPAGGCG